MMCAWTLCMVVCAMCASHASAQAHGQFWWLNLAAAKPTPQGHAPSVTARSIDEIFRNDFASLIEDEKTKTTEVIEGLLNSVWPDRNKEESKTKPRHPIFTAIPALDATTLKIPVTTPQATTLEEDAVLAFQWTPNDTNLLGFNSSHDSPSSEPSAPTPEYHTSQLEEHRDTCECVPFYQCDESDVIGRGTLDERFGLVFDSAPPPCGSDPYQVCCRSNSSNPHVARETASEGGTGLYGGNTFATPTQPTTPPINPINPAVAFNKAAVQKTPTADRDAVAPTVSQGWDSVADAASRPPTTSPPALTASWRPFSTTRAYSRPSSPKSDSWESGIVFEYDGIFDGATPPMISDPKDELVQPAATDSSDTSNLVEHSIFPDCGWRAPTVQLESRISAGGVANPTDNPWTLMVLRRARAPGVRGGAADPSEQIPICGASLLHPRVALTAYHCIAGTKTNQIKIRAGEYDFSKDTEELPHQERNVESILKRTDYYSGGLYNDIALLVWSVHFHMADNVRPICLPPRGFAFVGLTCAATGWGRDMNGVRHDVLHQARLGVVSAEFCEGRIRTTRLGPKFRLHPSFMCAGGGDSGEDTCKGDGGGPLVCQVKDRFVQVGVTSWGIGCDGTVPAAYTNVSVFTDWIHAELSTLGIHAQIPSDQT